MAIREWFEKIIFKNGSLPAINDENLNEIQKKINNGINKAFYDAIPIGCGIDYYLSELPDERFLWGDGSEISRTEYAELFEKMGETYGSGDGETTFNLPDKREAVTTMKSSSQNLGTVVGSNSHKLTNDELPKITGSFTAWAGVVTNSESASFFSSSSGCFSKDSSSSKSGCYLAAPVGTDRTNDIINLNIGGEDALDMRQKTLVCNYIIKVK